MKKLLLSQPMIIAVIAGLVVWGIAWAQGAYLITRYTVASSGQLAGGAYSLRAMAGQAPVNTLAGGRFTITGGYWYPAVQEDAAQLYLPTLQR